MNARRPLLPVLTRMFGLTPTWKDSPSGAATIAAAAQLLVAVVLGTLLFGPGPFPSGAYKRFFDSYNDRCENLVKTSHVEGQLVRSNYGPLILRGGRGSFTSPYEKQPDQTVRIRYKNYEIPGFGFLILAQGNRSAAEQVQNRFDLYKRSLRFGDLGRSDSFSVGFSGWLASDSPASFAYLNDQLEVTLLSPDWPRRASVILLMYLAGVSVFVLSARRLRSWGHVVGAGSALLVGLAVRSLPAAALMPEVQWIFVACVAGIFWFVSRRQARLDIKPYAVCLLVAWSVAIAAIACRTQGYSLAGDTSTYVGPATSFWSHWGFPGMVERTPGYPLFIALVDLISGRFAYENVAGAQRCLFALLPLLVFLCFYLGARRFWPALLAGFAVSVDFWLWTLPGWILTEAFSCFWATASVLCFVIAMRKPSWRSGAAAGLAAGFLALIRPTFVLWWILPALALLAPPAVEWLLRRRAEGRTRFLRDRRTAAAAAFLLGAALIVGGWTTRNAVRFGYFGVSSLGGTSVLSHLQHYPDALPTDTDTDRTIKSCVEQMIAANHGSDFSYFRLRDSISASLSPKSPSLPVGVMSLFRRFVLAHPRTFWDSLRVSASYYLRPLNLASDIRYETVMGEAPLIAPLCRAWNETPVVERLLLNPKALLALTLGVCIWLAVAREDRKTLCFLLCVLALVMYTMGVSIASVRDDQNNPRFQMPVLQFVMGLYVVGVCLLMERIGKLAVSLLRPRTKSKARSASPSQ